MTDILCYGDSNTFGYCHTEENLRYSEDKRWVNILSVMLGEGYNVFPEGLNGRTIASDWKAPWKIPGVEKNGLTALPEVLSKYPCPKLLIIMLGTNDCSFLLELSPEEITANLEKLALKAVEIETERFGKAPKIMIVSPSPILPETEGTPFSTQIDKTSAEKSKALPALYEEMAKQNGWLFLNAECEVSKVDCEHLTEKGHRELAEKLCFTIKNSDI